jgi:hypothetical protein
LSAVFFFFEEEDDEEGKEEEDGEMLLVVLLLFKLGEEISRILVTVAGVENLALGFGCETFDGKIESILYEPSFEFPPE